MQENYALMQDAIVMLQKEIRDSNDLVFHKINPKSVTKDNDRMMSAQENVQVVQQMFAALRQCDLVDALDAAVGDVISGSSS